MPIFGPQNFGTAMGILDILMKHGGNKEGMHSRFGIGKFKAQLDATKGLYKPSLYAVTINVPNSNWAPLDMRDERQFTFLCNSAALPGAQILSSDHRRQGYGTFDRRPFGIQVTDIPLTFFVDNKGFILGFFQNWFNNIIYYGDPGDLSEQPHTKASLFEVNYSTNYTCTIEIATYDHIGQEIITYTLYEAFPIQMGDITVAWAETDSFSVLPVQFTFRTYKTNKQPVNNAVGERAEATDTAGAKHASGKVVTPRQQDTFGGNDPRNRHKQVPNQAIHRGTGSQ